MRSTASLPKSQRERNGSAVARWFFGGLEFRVFFPYMLFHAAGKRLSRAAEKEFACCSKLFFRWRSEPFTSAFRQVILHIRKHARFREWLQFNRPGRAAAWPVCCWSAFRGVSGAVALSPVRLWRAAGRRGQSAADLRLDRRAAGGCAGLAVAA